MWLIESPTTAKGAWLTEILFSAIRLAFLTNNYVKKQPQSSLGDSNLLLRIPNRCLYLKWSRWPLLRNNQVSLFDAPAMNMAGGIKCYPCPSVRTYVRPYIPLRSTFAFKFCFVPLRSKLAVWFCLYVGCCFNTHCSSCFPCVFGPGKEIYHWT